jgi:hypothetical protein
MDKKKVFSFIAVLISNIFFIMLLPLYLFFGTLVESQPIVLWASIVFVLISLIASWVFYIRESYGKAVGFGFLPLAIMWVSGIPG